MGRERETDGGGVSLLRQYASDVHGAPESNGGAGEVVDKGVRAVGERLSLVSSSSWWWWPHADTRRGGGEVEENEGWARAVVIERGEPESSFTVVSSGARTWGEAGRQTGGIGENRISEDGEGRGDDTILERTSSCTSGVVVVVGGEEEGAGCGECDSDDDACGSAIREDGERGGRRGVLSTRWRGDVAGGSGGKVGMLPLVWGRGKVETVAVEEEEGNSRDVERGGGDATSGALPSFFFLCPFFMGAFFSVRSTGGPTHIQ